MIKFVRLLGIAKNFVTCVGLLLTFAGAARAEPIVNG